MITTSRHTVRSEHVDRHLQKLIDSYADTSIAIDVAKLVNNQRCPRCVDRRVIAVDEHKNLWLCVPSAMPVVWDRSQTREHDATQDLQDR